MVRMKRFFKFNDIFKFTKRDPHSNEVLKVCPVCLRTSLEIVTNRNLSAIVPPTYFCHFCNYKGPIFAEISIEDYKKIDFDNFDYSIEENQFKGQDEIV